jgi:hypothetical protein
LNRSGSFWTRSFADATRKFISTLGEDLDGELYLGERGEEDLGVYRLIAIP